MLVVFYKWSIHMKKDTHPKYQKVLFVDSSTGYKFVCGTTLQPEGTEKFDGVEYPVYHLAISSASHPLFTGSSQLLDAEGRVDKFHKRYGSKKETKETKVEAKVETKKDAKPEVKKDAKPEVKKEAKPEVKKETKVEAKVEPKKEAKKEAKKGA